MLDFLVALGGFICFIGLLYGLILTLGNWKYSGEVECRYDPMVGHGWGRDPAERLELVITPEQSITTIELSALDERPHESEKEPRPYSNPARERSLAGSQQLSR